MFFTKNVVPTVTIANNINLADNVAVRWMTFADETCISKIKMRIMTTTSMNSMETHDGYALNSSSFEATEVILKLSS